MPDKKAAPVNKATHAQKRAKEITSFNFASRFHIAYVMLQEFTRAASIYLITCLDNTARDEFRPVVMVGRTPGTTVFVDADGKWRASHISAVIRGRPTNLAPHGADGQFIMCLDEVATWSATPKAMRCSTSRARRPRSSPT